jgi:predicted Zn-dependent protease
MIAATDDGVYMDINRSWSIDDKRLNFQFGCEIGWEIKNGKRAGCCATRRTPGSGRSSGARWTC